jgi:hypothetical protein
MLSKVFREEFKRNSFSNRFNLVEDLSKIFDLPYLHFARAVLGRYYFTYPYVFFDRKDALALLEAYFNEGSFFIINNKELFTGGYSKESLSKKFIQDFGSVVNSIEISALNWNAFFDSIFSNYCEKVLLNSDFFNNTCLFEEKAPKSFRENVLSKGILVIESEKNELKKYSFFNIDECLKLYIRLFDKFYSEFKIIDFASSKNEKRYGKVLVNNYYLGFYVNLKVIVSQLKKGYLDLPVLEFEIFTKEISKDIQVIDYISELNEYIGRIDVFYNMGRFSSMRIGNASEDANILQKRLYFYFEVYAYYFKIYIKHIEENILQIGS